MATNFGLTAPPAGVTPAQLSSDGLDFSKPAEQSGGFFSTTGGKIASGLLGGIGGLALAGIIGGHTKKVREAKALQEQSLSNLRKMQIAPEEQLAYQQSQQMGNQGMDAASQQLAIQEQARGMNTGINALSGRRSILAGAPGLFASSNDFALRLAAQNAMMRGQNKQAAIQSGFQMGKDVLGLQQYKNEGLYTAGVNRQNQLHQNLMGGIKAAVDVGGAAVKAMAGGA